MDLHVALDEIQWGDGHVSEAAAEYSSGRACGVVHGRVHGYAALLGRRDHEAPPRPGGGWRRIIILALDQTRRRQRRGVEIAGDP